MNDFRVCVSNLQDERREGGRCEEREGEGGRETLIPSLWMAAKIDEMPCCIMRAVVKTMHVAS